MRCPLRPCPETFAQYRIQVTTFRLWAPRPIARGRTAGLMDLMLPSGRLWLVRTAAEARRRTDAAHLKAIRIGGPLHRRWLVLLTLRL